MGSKAATRAGGPSLQARALRWLAQREHSRVELRRKLMRAARGSVESTAATDGVQGEAADAADATETSDATDAADASERVEAVLDWLEAHRYLSAERFVESRVAARRARFGGLRIALELKQHGVAMTAEAAASLSAGESARARALLERRYREPPADGVERARRARFLAARGFAPDAIRRAMRESSWSDAGAEPPEDSASDRA